MNITDILLLDVLWVLLLKALRVLVVDVSRFVAHCFVRSERFVVWCLVSFLSLTLRESRYWTPGDFLLLEALCVVGHFEWFLLAVLCWTEVDFWTFCVSFVMRRLVSFIVECFFSFMYGARRFKIFGIGHFVSFITEVEFITFNLKKNLEIYSKRYLQTCLPSAAVDFLIPASRSLNPGLLPQYSLKLCVSSQRERTGTWLDLLTQLWANSRSSGWHPSSQKALSTTVCKQLLCLALDPISLPPPPVA